MADEDNRKYLRALMLAARRCAAPARIAESSLAVQRRVLASDEYRSASHVMLYAAVAGEVANDLVFEDALASGRAVYFPLIDQKSKTMRAVRVRSRDELQPADFGILAPRTDGDELDSRGITSLLICVPLVAIDPNGNRLGMGGGYYDRFIASLSDDAITMGLAHSFQLLGRVAPRAHDRAIKIIVTEFARYAPAQNRRAHAPRAEEVRCHF